MKSENRADVSAIEAQLIEVLVAIDDITDLLRNTSGAREISSAVRAALDERDTSAVEDAGDRAPFTRDLMSALTGLQEMVEALVDIEDGFHEDVRHMVNMAFADPMVQRAIAAVDAIVEPDGAS